MFKPWSQLTADEKSQEIEKTWRKRERQLVRKERRRLIRNGIILEERYVLPQMMSKIDGRWVACLAIYPC